MTPPLRVVVPVHAVDDANLADVRRCLESVLRHAPDTEVPFDVLVIDDASPHGSIDDLVAALPVPDGLSVTLAHHTENRGFVASANEGFASTAGDVVLLNSDTMVTAGWLDRMTATAARHDRTATVTPLTNAGSICTLPTHLRAAFDLDGAEPRVDECAAFVAARSLALEPAIISGVGFCMLVTRPSLDACGAFDEETFGRGYGEEVDFCLRASAAGFGHRAQDATFVFHRGGGSFGEDRAEAMARASTLLHRRHPGFKQRNRREQANPPLAPVFADLGAALAPRDPRRPHVLHLLHAPSRYGGTEKQLAALVDSLRADIDASTLYPSPEGFVLRSEWRSPDGTDHVATRLLPGARGVGLDDASTDQDESGEEAPPAPERSPVETETSALRVVRDLFDLTAVHVHNLIGHPLETLSELADFPGVVVCSVHDLYLACPNHSLLYEGVSPCGIPEDLEVCARCLPSTRGLTRDDLEHHRAVVSAGLASVDHWVTFSQSAADHLRRAYPIPADRLHLIPHGSLVTGAEPPLDEAHLLDGPLRVAFVGRGWAKKGLDLVNRAAERLAGDPDVELHHFGELRDPISPRVRAHGAYDNTRLAGLLRAAGIGVVLIPGPYAETFGFVMSEALLAGLPVIGPYYGAIGERIAAGDVGWTIDPEDDDSLPTLLGDLAGCRLEVVRAARRARSTPTDPHADSAARYAELYRPTTEPTMPQDGTPA